MKTHILPEEPESERAVPPAALPHGGGSHIRSTILVAYHRLRLLLTRGYTPKNGIMYVSQGFALKTGAEPLRVIRCDLCDKEQPHTFWPDGPYRCIYCIHTLKTVDYLQCHVCGPAYHTLSSDDGAKCYRCWLTAARCQLDGMKAQHILPIRKPVRLLWARPR